MVEFTQTLGLSFLICLMMVGILSHFGIHVLKREIIFIDIALAQIAAVGAIAAHMVFHAHGDSIISYVCAFGFTIIAAAFYAFVHKKVAQIPLEAVIGVSYAAAAAAALFLVGVAPGGHVHVQEMLAGSILWATWKDVLWCAIIFSIVALCFVLLRKPFAQISENYQDAIRQEKKTICWDFLFYVLLGSIITICVRIAGVVVVFAFLIIPATISAIFSLSTGQRWVIACVTGAIASVFGLLFSNYLDFSVGPSIALFLGIILVLAGVFRIPGEGHAAEEREGVC